MYANDLGYSEPYRYLGEEKKPFFWKQYLLFKLN